MNQFIKISEDESGQVMLFVVLALGLFLLGAMAFAIDLSHMWFQRQSAQTAADAACTAGAMDLLVDATDGGTSGGFTPSASNVYDCHDSTTAGDSPCQYAALNGFNSSVASGSTNLGNNVSFDFPQSGKAGAPPGASTPPATQAPVPFLRVKVTNNVPTFFAGMLKGKSTQSIQAYAVCGLQLAQAPIPILVLHPTFQGSLSIQGGGGTTDIGIIGGPQQSIQVNSCSSSASTTKTCGLSDAASLGGNANVNLCQGGPGFCGANMGVFGPEANPGNKAFTTSCGTNALCTGSQRTPQWSSPQAPISDPFARTAAPAQPSAGSTPYIPSDLDASNSANDKGKPCASSDIAAGKCFVKYQIHGCPDSTATAVPPTNKSGCQLFTPGYYPNGIDVKNGVAVFDAGLYWLETNSGNCSSTKSFTLCLEANSFVRPSFYKGTYTTTVPAWFGYNDGTAWDGGTIFYFHGTGSVVVDSNSGKTNGGTAPDSFGNNAWQFASATADTLVTCPNGGTTPSPAIPTSLGGNILLAPCSLTGTWGDPGSSPTFASDRGILFFQDRGNASTGGKATVQASWGGGGQFLLAGTMYFHQCVISAADTGTGCDTTTPAFNVQLSLSGNSGSTTYVLGEIIADQLNLGGGGSIAMHLSPSAKFNILKVSLLQ